jgi:hypothetical protein
MVDIFEAVAIVKYGASKENLGAKVAEMIDQFGKDYVYFDEIIMFRGNKQKI